MKNRAFFAWFCYDRAMSDYKKSNRNNRPGRNPLANHAAKSHNSGGRKPYPGKKPFNTHAGAKKPSLAIQPTTLWDYPSQHYGNELQGDPPAKPRVAGQVHLAHAAAPQQAFHHEVLDRKADWEQRGVHPANVPTR